MSTPEESLRRLYDGVWNDSNPAVADELVHESYTIHDRELAAELQGPALYRALAEHTRNVFPDMTITIEETIALDDVVALRWTMTGTHRGELYGIAPTDRRVELSAIEIDHFEDGLLVETWTQSDQLGLVQQIGGEISNA